MGISRVMGISVAIILLLALTQECLTQEGKSISIFNVVKFPNDACEGTGDQSGTCYTAEECSSIGGSNAGSCAEGYGVCCTISLTCTTGSMSHTTSQNNTHLILAATTTPPQQCNYAICPLSSGICRIRLDFSGSICLDFTKRGYRGRSYGQMPDRHLFCHRQSRWLPSNLWWKPKSTHVC